MSTFSRIQADGTTIAWPSSPQRNLQPTGGGTVADAPQYTAQAVTAAGGTTAMNDDARVCIVDTNGAVENINLPDPRVGGANLTNGYVVWVINLDSAGGGGDVTVQSNSGGNLLYGSTFVVTNVGAAQPQSNGAAFMVLDNTNQNGWTKTTL